MTEKTVRDVPRQGFIYHLASHLYRNHILECPVMSRNPERAKRFESFKKWWFLEASKLIIQWYEAPSLPPQMSKIQKPTTKEEQSMAFKMKSLYSLIKQYVELGWVIQDKTGIMVVTDLGREQLDSIAIQFKQKVSAQEQAQNTNPQEEQKEGSLSLATQSTETQEDSIEKETQTPHTESDQIASQV